MQCGRDDHVQYTINTFFDIVFSEARIITALPYEVSSNFTRSDITIFPIDHLLYIGQG